MSVTLFYRLFVVIGLTMILQELKISLIRVFLFTIILLILYEVLKDFIQEGLGIFK